MDIHFMTRRCAIKHLMEVRREAAANPNSRAIVNTHLREEFGAGRIERVLLDVRAAPRFIFCAARFDGRRPNLFD
jgi:hypothetical protein